MSTIASSIQEYGKKINSRITGLDILSLLVTMLSLGVLYGVILHSKELYATKVIYTEGSGIISSHNSGVSNGSQHDARPFGSKKGTTYTFSWCTRSGAIRDINKIYFVNEEEAKRSGRTLSKLCKK